MANDKRLPYLKKRQKKAVSATVKILLEWAKKQHVGTYSELGKELTTQLGFAKYEKQDRFALAELLGCVKENCEEFKLPILPALVVNKTTGTSGQGLTQHYPDIESEQKKVFSFWK